MVKMLKESLLTQSSLLESFRAGGHDEGHLMDNKPIEPEAFFNEAAYRLPRLAQEVDSEVIPHLEQHAGKWHPLGFAVYPLGVDGVGCSLRLHVWPRAKRRVESFGPNIHNHAWQLSSYVMRGKYVDTLFDKVNVGGRDESVLIYFPFQLSYGEGGVNNLNPQGGQVALLPLETRVVGEGKIHHIKDDVFHLPEIEETLLTATLVLDSPALPYDTTVLLGAPEQISFSREPVTPEQTEQIKGELCA